MDPASPDALVSAFKAFDSDPSASVAVLWGEGGAFCAGWDLRYASTLSDRDAFQRDIVEGLAFPTGANPAPRGPLGPTRLELSKPVIGAVEGPAVAGGMELALWCDVRVMAESAYFGVYCRRWGIPLLDGGSVPLARPACRWPGNCICRVNGPATHRAARRPVYLKRLNLPPSRRWRRASSSVCWSKARPSTAY